MPIVIGLSDDSSFRAPMAWAVIGGLFTSTLLSLIVIPAAFTVVDDLGQWVTRHLRPRTGPGAPDPGVQELTAPSGSGSPSSR